MDWFRWWQGTVTDPKFRVIARRSRQPISLVITCWAYLLEDAHENGNCGDSFDAESCAACLDAEPEDIQAIIDALTDKGLLDEGRLVNWSKRQPNREDNSKERVRRHRERKRNETHVTEDVTQCNADETQGNAPDTETDTEKDINTSAPPACALEDDRTPLPAIPESLSHLVNFFTRKGFKREQVQTAKLVPIFKNWIARRMPFSLIEEACAIAETKNSHIGTPAFYVPFVEELIVTSSQTREKPPRRPSQKQPKNQKFNGFDRINQNRRQPNEQYAGNTFDGEYYPVETGKQ